MYNPPKFLTKEVLTEVLNEFEWPSPFEIKKEGIKVTGIIVNFPKCNIYFIEGFESDMNFKIANPLAKEVKYWSSFKLLNYVYRPIMKADPLFKEPKIDYYFDFPNPSLGSVQHDLRNLCTLIQTYLMPCVNGDFSLIDEYNAVNPDKMI